MSNKNFRTVKIKMEVDVDVFFSTLSDENKNITNEEMNLGAQAAASVFAHKHIKEPLRQEIQISSARKSTGPMRRITLNVHGERL